MQLKLTRTELAPDHTLGRLTIEGASGTFFTIEQPWANNRPFHSCVPPGQYTLEPHDTPKHPQVWALVNPALLIFHELPPNPPAGARSACLIHSANWAFELEGCIAPGLGTTLSPRGPMVTSSVEALARLRGLLGPGRHSLEITVREGA